MRVDWGHRHEEGAGVWLEAWQADALVESVEHEMDRAPHWRGAVTAALWRAAQGIGQDVQAHAEHAVAQTREGGRFRYFLRARDYFEAWRLQLVADAARKVARYLFRRLQKRRRFWLVEDGQQLVWPGHPRYTAAMAFEVATGGAKYPSAAARGSRRRAEGEVTADGAEE